MAQPRRVSRVRCGSGWKGDGRCQNSSYHQRCQALRRGTGKAWKSSKERIWKSSRQVILGCFCQGGFKMHWESMGKLHIHLCTSKTVSPSFCTRLRWTTNLASTSNDMTTLLRELHLLRSPLAMSSLHVWQGLLLFPQFAHGTDISSMCLSIFLYLFVVITTLTLIGIVLAMTSITWW